MFTDAMLHSETRQADGLGGISACNVLGDMPSTRDHFPVPYLDTSQAMRCVMCVDDFFYQAIITRISLESILCD